MASEPVGLLDLPNEILLAIWNAVLPSDIDNFAITCRHLHLLGVDVLAEHQSWKRAHSNICLLSNQPSALFRLYGEYESRISHYPKKLTVIPEGGHSLYNDDDDNYVRDMIRLMATEERTLSPSEILISSFDLSVRDRWAGLLTALLVRSLPNLEAIHYSENSRCQDSESFARGLTNGIMELSTRSSSVDHPSVFARLSHLSLSITQTHGPRRPLGPSVTRPLGPFLQLLVLPNLRSFEISDFSCTDFDTLPFHPRASRVERLHISLRVYSSRSMLTLLSAFEALKTFKLRIVQGRVRQVQRFFPAVYACLLENFQNSLQRLEIDDGNANPEFFGSLRPFSVLKSIVIQPDLLISAVSADHSVMPRLIDGFPSSIEEIKFTRSLTETQEDELFAGFLHGLDATVPNLRLVISCQFLNWAYKENSQPGGEYRFRYIRYRDDIVTVQYIDFSLTATRQWRGFRLPLPLPIDNLKRKR